MLISIDPHSGVPIYLQIIEQIRFHIASGLLKAGDEIPSTRALSQQLGVNPMTISKAFSMLEEERMLQRRPGLPSVVRRHSAETIDQERLDHLRTILTPALTAARQLGISSARAAQLFRQLLDEATKSEDAA